MKQVLIVDDVPAMAEQYAYDLKRVGRYQTSVAAGGEAALEVLAREPIDCVVLDLEMPGIDGFDVLRRMQHRGIDTPVIVYTGTGSYDRCVQAVRLGAYGFVDKAEPSNAWFRRSTTRCHGGDPRRRAAIAAVRRGRRTIPHRRQGRRCDRSVMRLPRVAPIPSSVLIVGESGTGKELVARALHRQGPGDKTPLVAVNSAALPEQLVESELFGHERGAFTGADRLRRGAFENAGSGTLFLDEIGELPLPAQAKLLRVLEERKVMRVGGDRAVPMTACRRGNQPATSSVRSRAAASVRICTIASTSTRCVCRPCASDCLTCRCSSSICFVRSPRTSGCGRRQSHRKPSHCSRRTTGGKTTSASCETAWSG